MMMVPNGTAKTYMSKMATPNRVMGGERMPRRLFMVIVKYVYVKKGR